MNGEQMPLEEQLKNDQEFQNFLEDFAEKHKESGLSIEVYGKDDADALVEVADLDKELFGEHKSLPLEAFQDIVEKGGLVIGVRNKEGRLVGEASLVLNNNPDDGESQIERNLPEYLAYCDGAAVHPGERGKGIQRELLQAREMAAKDAGKEFVSASVRQKNLPSIKSMLREGYMITADAPHYYGDEPGDARIFLTKMIEAPNPMDSLTTDNEGLDYESQGITEPADVTSAIETGQDVISIEVTSSEDVDASLNATISQLLNNGYVGVSCKTIETGDGEASVSDAMTFVKAESIPHEPFTRTISVQEDLKKIFV